MAEIRTSHLMTMKLAVSGLQPIGDTPAGHRRIGLVAGGTFEGPKLRGTVLPGGADWIIVKAADGSFSRQTLGNRASDCRLASKSRMAP